MGKFLKVIVAEDNNINQKLMTRILGKFGYSAIICDNGEKVLEELDKEKVDLILMDVHMPIMDGYETTKAIVQKYGDNRPKIIALTASALQGDMQKCFDAGMDDYISKPIMMDDLRIKLNEWESKI